ncbi:sodium-hydrogen antiporter [Pyrenophora tritici-repentis]|uniref:Sodium-hydrogen antiporter n=1 Tax=Pyrenophora tritici-repentis TaxID=45151 RepID=A0A2W1HKW7_9PLEO|nr:Sodium-hydrogen antiporter [Pyrenophora tritici-repentis]KAF7443354.1 Sodium-hydrogen antiporter [Pyrenophora tritici-repentis]KAF7568155.1 sodium-hydrogen antiporter [Pyrenophora tritici-repentis]KAG9376959.1 Sodium-hydrogen antiporter [Pyrenophora tritici-repentis]KAI0573446.1 Sodium-hydrogen antiporter [Pyrenophora tritici-repentis]
MAGDSSATQEGFLQYHEPNIIQILVLVSFFFWLSFGEWLSNRVFRAGLIGQIIVGLIYGLPIGGDIIPIPWQEAFIALGYIGLVLIIFEGALAVRLDLLKANFGLSIIAATIGVVAPVAFTYILLYIGFGYGAVETFIVGAALSVTSLGTTFVVLGKTSKDINFSDTRVGTVLVSAAVFDDVSGLVMASVIGQLGALGGEDSPNLGWLIGRPTLVSGVLAILTPVLNKWIIAPLYRKYAEPRLPKTRKRHVVNVVIMILVLCAFLSITGFGGTSVLYGSFMAGASLTYIPSKHPTGPFHPPSREDAEEAEARSIAETGHDGGEPEISPTFMHTFEKYFLDVVKYLLQPLFFASIGFAIPFIDLWTAEAIWKGLVYTILMLITKVVVGLVIPVSTIINRPAGVSIRQCISESFWPAMLLGSAMVARGEIGLLVVQIGFNNTSYLSKEAFITAVWAIMLNTILGPVSVGLIIKYKARSIADGMWGLDKAERSDSTWDDGISRANTIIETQSVQEQKKANGEPMRSPSDAVTLEETA